MTVNTARGQTLNFADLHITVRWFSRGQLYGGLSHANKIVLLYCPRRPIESQKVTRNLKKHTYHMNTSRAMLWIWKKKTIFVQHCAQCRAGQLDVRFLDSQQIRPEQCRAMAAQITFIVITRIVNPTEWSTNDYQSDMVLWLGTFFNYSTHW